MDHKNLNVWKESIDLVTHVYKICEMLPDSEKYGLISQLKRAAVSMPSNIAEGAARNSDKEYIHFLYIALGSLSEIETQIVIAFRLSFINGQSLIDKEISSLRKQLLGLIKYLKSQIQRPDS